MLKSPAGTVCRIKQAAVRHIDFEGHNFSCILGLILVFCTLFNPVFAADPTQEQLNQLQRKTDQLIQEEQLRQEQLLKEQDARRRPPGTIELEIEKQLPETGESRQCFLVNTIVLEGSHSLTDAERQTLTDPFIGKCIGLIEIRELLRVITNFYIDKGYVTTRAYIPQQDLGSGTLKLLIVEGLTQGIETDTESAGVNLATAFPGLEGEVLNIRDIEQGLDQINRLQSNNAAMELQPGETPGQTRIIVKNDPGNRISGSLTADDYGSESLGDYRGTATLNIDNPLGVNDFWLLSLTNNIDDNSGDSLSRTALGSFNIPYGYWMLSGSHSKYEYESLLTSLTQNFKSSGETLNTNLTISRVLDRGQTNKLTASAGLTHKNTKNFIEDVRLDTSSRRLTVLNMNLTGVFLALGGSWTVDGGMSLGLDLFGVDELPAAGKGTVPTSEFTRFNLSASYSRPFALAGMNLSWSSSLQAQYGIDYLPGTEQISIGGLYTVRGYDITSISGDRGAYWRNDLAVSLPRFASTSIAKWVGVIQPYMAIDAGHILSRDGQKGGTLIGAAIGVRNRSGLINCDIAYGVPVDYSDYLDSGVDNRVENSAVYLKLGVSI